MSTRGGFAVLYSKSVNDIACDQHKKGREKEGVKGEKVREMEEEEFTCISVHLLPPYTK